MTLSSLPPPPKGLDSAWYAKMEKKRAALAQWHQQKRDAKLLRNAVPWWPAIALGALSSLAVIASSNRRLVDFVLFSFGGWLAAAVPSHIRAARLDRRAERELAESEDALEPQRPEHPVPGQADKTG